MVDLVEVLDLLEMLHLNHLNHLNHLLGTANVEFGMVNGTHRAQGSNQIRPDLVHHISN